MTPVPGLCLTPWGMAGDEPMAPMDGQIMGVREAVWRGYLTPEQGKKHYPQGDWSVLDGAPEPKPFW